MRMLMKLVLLTAAAVTFGILAGCDQAKDLTAPVGASGGGTLTQVTNGRVVYTAGYYLDGNGDPVSCYWSNNCRIDLPSGPSNTGAAHSIYLSGNTVYIGGYYNTGSDDIACYWADNRTSIRKVDLNRDGKRHSFVKSTYVYGGVVYSAGYYNDSSRNIPCYWIGTNKFDLGSDGVNDSQAYFIIVNLGTVFTAGSTDDGLLEKACYWSNQTRFMLDRSTNRNSAANALLVDSSGNIHTAGYFTDSNGKGQPCYWLNTNRTIIGGGLYNGQAKSIYLKNSNLYIAGFYSDSVNIPCYWIIKGGKTNKVDLPGLTGFPAQAYSLSIIDNQVYTSGWYRNSSTSIPCFWSGTDRTDLPGEGMTETTCLYVK